MAPRVGVDGGTFDWGKYAEDYPEVGQENPAYRGVNSHETFAPTGFTYAAIARDPRDLGNTQSPFDARVTLRKLESFPMRMERHCENAMAVAEFPDDRPEVAWVNYPGVESHETHGLASEYLEGGCGGMVTFGLILSAVTVSRYLPPRGGEYLD